MSHRVSPLVVPTLAVALAACAGDAPTSPAAPVADAPVLALAVSGAPLDALRAMVADARERVVPAVGDGPAQSRLDDALRHVDVALAASDAAALTASLGDARAAIDAEARALGAESPAAADLDALSLTLDAVEQAVPAS